MTPAAKRPTDTVGILLIVIAIAAALTGTLLDGFVGGMLIGGGVALAMLGTLHVAMRLGWSKRRADDDARRDGWWLPSQDRARTADRAEDGTAE